MFPNPRNEAEQQRPARQEINRAAPSYKRLRQQLAQSGGQEITVDAGQQLRQVRVLPSKVQQQEQITHDLQKDYSKT